VTSALDTGVQLPNVFSDPISQNCFQKTKGFAEFLFWFNKTVIPKKRKFLLYGTLKDWTKFFYHVNFVIPLNNKQNKTLKSSEKN
jgi:hypothetical protein